jgi:hypothetical protein
MPTTTGRSDERLYQMGAGYSSTVERIQTSTMICKRTAPRPLSLQGCMEKVGFSSSSVPTAPRPLPLRGRMEGGGRLQQPETRLEGGREREPLRRLQRPEPRLEGGREREQLQRQQAFAPRWAFPLSPGSANPEQNKRTI